MHLHYPSDDKKSQVRIDELIEIEVNKTRDFARIFHRLALKIPQEKQIKTSLKVMHFFNLAVGLALLITGSVLFRRRHHGRFFLGKRVFLVLAITLAVNGFSLAIFSCFGFLTLGKKKLPVLIHGISGLIVAIMVTIVSVRVPNNEILLLHTESNMFSTLSAYNGSDFVKDVWDQTQTSLQCCGVKNATDWCEMRENYDRDHCSLPYSCFKCPPYCIDGDWKVLYSSTFLSSKVYQRGCLNPIIYHLSESIALYMNLNYLLIGLLTLSAIVSLVMFSRKRPKIPPQEAGKKPKNAIEPPGTSSVFSYKS